MTTKTINWTPARVRANLRFAPWLERAAVVLFERQTPRERNLGRTVVSNGAGFNAPDAKRLSPLCERLRNGGKANAAELAMLRKLLPKYARQLAQVANERGGSIKA